MISRALLVPHPRGDGSAARSVQATFLGLISLLALALGLLSVATAAAAPTRNRVPVFFLQGEQLVRVSRPGSTPANALRQLVSGPTRAEIERGVRTHVPEGT